MIKLYRAFTDGFDGDELNRVYEKLSVEARARVDGYKNGQSRKNSLVGHWLLMRGVKELFGREDCEVFYTETGKPCLGFCKFSIAHTENMAVCAFSDTEIGIDVELLRPIKVRDGYPFFNEKECGFVNADQTEHDTRFMRIWTRKEAYVKMLGSTMSKDGGIDVSDKVSGAVFSEYDFGRFIITVCEAEGN